MPLAIVSRLWVFTYGNVSPLKYSSEKKFSSKRLRSRTIGRVEYSANNHGKNTRTKWISVFSLNASGGERALRDLGTGAKFENNIKIEMGLNSDGLSSEDVPKLWGAPPVGGGGELFV
jgi:hypothetical protein